MDVKDIFKQTVERENKDIFSTIVNSQLDTELKSLLLSSALKNGNEKAKTEILQWFKDESKSLKELGDKYYTFIGKLNDFNANGPINYATKHIAINDVKGLEYKLETLQYPTSDYIQDILQKLKAQQSKKQSSNTFTFEKGKATAQDIPLIQLILSLHDRQINIQQFIEQINVDQIKQLDFACKIIVLNYISAVDFDQNILDTPITIEQVQENKGKSQCITIKDKILKITEQLQLRAMIWLYQYATTSVKQLITKQIFKSIAKTPNDLDTLQDYELLRFLMEYYTNKIQYSTKLPQLKKEADESIINYEQQGSDQVIVFTNFYINHLANIFGLQTINKEIINISDYNQYSLINYLRNRLLDVSTQTNQVFNVRQIKYVEIYFLLYYITFYLHKTTLKEQKCIEQFMNYLVSKQNNLFIVQSSKDVKCKVYKIDQLNVCLTTQLSNKQIDNVQPEICYEKYILNQENNLPVRQLQHNDHDNLNQNIFDKWVLNEEDWWKEFHVTNGSVFIDTLESYVVVFECENQKIRFNRVQHHLINNSQLNLEYGLNSQIKLSVFNDIDQIIELQNQDYEILNAQDLNVVLQKDSNNKTHHFVQANKTHNLFVKYKYNILSNSLDTSLIKTFIDILTQNNNKQHYIKLAESEYYYEYVSIAPSIPLIQPIMLITPKIQQLISQGSRNVTFYIALLGKTDQQSEYQAIQIPNLPQCRIIVKQVSINSISQINNAYLEEINEDDNDTIIQNTNGQQRWYKFTTQIQDDTQKLEIGCNYTVYGKVYEVPKININLIDEEKVFTLNYSYSSGILDIQVLNTANMNPVVNLDVDVALYNQKESITTDSQGFLHIKNIQFDNIADIACIINGNSYSVPVWQRSKLCQSKEKTKYIQENNEFKLCLQEWNSEQQQYYGEIQNASTDKHLQIKFQPLHSQFVSITSYNNMLQYRLPQKPLFDFKVKCNGFTSPLQIGTEITVQAQLCQTYQITQKLIEQSQNSDYQHSISMIFDNDDQIEVQQLKNAQQYSYHDVYGWVNKNLLYKSQQPQQHSIKVFNCNIAQLEQVSPQSIPLNRIKLYQIMSNGMMYESYEE